MKSITAEILRQEPQHQTLTKLKKRVMKQYQKINTMYKRDMEGTKKIIIGEFCDPEVEYLKNLKWECTEKIDGTNISVVWDGHNVKFHGKTSNADLPEHLLTKLKQLFPIEKLEKVFPLKYDDEGAEIPLTIILYGEGYGYRIQKGGNYLSKDVNFILFDVNITDFWLTRENCEKIASSLEIDIVPLIGYMTIKEAEDMVSKGFISKISENRAYEAEGLVCKTPCGLLARNGKRVIVKIKTIDYKALRAK